VLPEKEFTMRSITWNSRLALTMALMFGLFTLSALSAPNPTSAQQAASAATSKITIHKATCPSGTANLFKSCHDKRVAGVGFTVAGVSRHTDANGVVSWGPSAGTWKIHEFSTDFTGNAWVYCKDLTSGKVLFDGRTTTGNVTITTVAGHNNVCDWYNLT
jgi:hypothetical protein